MAGTGNGRAKEDQGDMITLKRGTTGAAYLQARLRRDAPELADALNRGEIKSVRAAAIEAGIIIPFPSIQIKEPLPTAQKLLAKKGQEWCLQLLEELSELVLLDPASLVKGNYFPLANPIRLGHHDE